MEVLQAATPVTTQEIQMRLATRVPDKVEALLATQEVTQEVVGTTAAPAEAVVLVQVVVPAGAAKAAAVVTATAMVVAVAAAV